MTLCFKRRRRACAQLARGNKNFPLTPLLPPSDGSPLQSVVLVDFPCPTLSSMRVSSHTPWPLPTSPSPRRALLPSLAGRTLLPRHAHSILKPVVVCVDGVRRSQGQLLQARRLRLQRLYARHVQPRGTPDPIPRFDKPLSWCACFIESTAYVGSERNDWLAGWLAG